MKNRNNVTKFGKRKRGWNAPLIIAGAALAGVAGAYLWNVPQGQVETATVSAAMDEPMLLASDPDQPYLELCEDGPRSNCVVDGDTLWLNGKKIRVADIDTPEIGSPKCDYEYDLGMRATYRFRDLLNEGPFSVEGIGNRDTDRYGRQLRVITRNGQSIGDMLVSEGLARTWTGRREPWC